MEDTLVLDHFMSEKYPDDRLLAFTEYSKHRNPDAEAMCDLAMYNYIEMRDLVNKTSFLLRKKVDLNTQALRPNIILLRHLVNNINIKFLLFSWITFFFG